MVRFYRDVLGFEIKEDENTSNVFLEKDGTLFLLHRKTDFGSLQMHLRKYHMMERNQCFWLQK